MCRTCTCIVFGATTTTTTTGFGGFGAAKPAGGGLFGAGTTTTTAPGFGGRHRSTITVGSSVFPNFILVGYNNFVV